jgi:hypothetical protein
MRLPLNRSYMNTSILGGAKPFQRKTKKEGAAEADRLSRNLQH